MVKGSAQALVVSHFEYSQGLSLHTGIEVRMVTVTEKSARMRTEVSTFSACTTAAHSCYKGTRLVRIIRIGPRDAASNSWLSGR